MNDSQNQSILKTKYLIGTLFFTLITAIGEWVIVIAYLEQLLSLVECVFVHFGVVFVLIVWMVLLKTINEDFRLVALILLMTTATGPFGSFISILMLIFYFLFSKSDISFLQWLTAMFPEENIEKSVELYQRLSAGWDDFSDKQRIMTFLDAISLGTIQQKREALSKISRYYRREFAPALMNALHDSNNAIRVQAATVISKFEQEYTSRYMLLSKQHQADPENMSILLKLAQQADAYAYSGILDWEREESFQQIAASKYKAYLDKEAGDIQTQFALGRLYIHLRKPDQALEKLKQFIEPDQKLPLNLVMWLVENLYQLQKYDEIRQLVKQYEKEATSNTNYPLIIKNTLQFWGRGIPEDKLVIR